MRHITSRFKRLFFLVNLTALLFVALGGRAVSAIDYDTYTVQAGDTLIDIAVRYGLSVAELAEANTLSGDAWVYVGQQLLIPILDHNRHVIPPEPVDRSAFLVDVRVPDPLPELPTLPLPELSAGGNLVYARVLQDNTPVYSDPAAAVQGGEPKRWLGTGFIWVSVEGQTAYEGHDYYQINAGEYVPAEALSLYQPSTFHGVALAAHPERPFAWVLKPVQPALAPGGEVNAAAPGYGRYDLVQIFATERLGDQVWYLVGPQQWINQVYVGKVEAAPRPEGVGPDELWVEVNLFEQTLAAYAGDRMVYATLVSSGLPGWDTPPGLFQVWLKVATGKMSGAYNRPDYYFLEDVRWTMYFNHDIALHTAYWHDGFGYKHSHGCVNLAPYDARWLYEWAPENLFVWVH